MTVKLIKNEQQHEAVLNRADILFDALPGSDEGEELELLLLVIKAYEDGHHPVLSPDC